MRRLLAAMCVAVGCGGHISPETPSDAAAPSTDYKVAIQSAGLGQARVWHSRDGAISPLGYPRIGPFTYDGKYMVVNDATGLTVLDRNATVVRTQTFPQGVTPEIAWPRNDATRVVLSSFSGAEGTATFATLDADGTYAVIASGNYRYAKYAPDGVTLIVAANHAIWSMKDDGSSLEQLFVTDELEWVEDVAFSDDQTRIAVTSYSSKWNVTTWVLTVLDLGASSTTFPLPVEMAAVFQPTFIPDGSGVVFFGWKGLYSEVFLADVSSQNVSTIVPKVGSGYQTDGAIYVARD